MSFQYKLRSKPAKFQRHNQKGVVLTFQVSEYGVEIQPSFCFQDTYTLWFAQKFIFFSVQLQSSSYNNLQGCLLSIAVSRTGACGSDTIVRTAQQGAQLAKMDGHCRQNTPKDSNLSRMTQLLPKSSSHHKLLLTI